MTVDDDGLFGFRDEPGSRVSLGCEPLRYGYFLTASALVGPYA
ncbi:hypothetical protein [Streptomyces xantholiticus]|nr:hypothetical protein [Streptomyces xantholiticus]